MNGERKMGTGKTWLISDLHFDHTNIIHYCSRPFANAEEMNKVLLNNWNGLVSPDDEAYFLGDMTFGRGSRPPSFWLSQLHGNIHYIRGNHDQEKIMTKDKEYLEHASRKFLLIHDPEKKPGSWKGWTIHGHKHNNDLKNYPFINGERKTITLWIARKFCQISSIRISRFGGTSTSGAA